MKKSQRARLSALAAKDAATLTADEKAELATLQTLAAAHPDASQDADDTSAAAPAAATAPVAAASTPPTLGSVIKGAWATLGDKARLGSELAQARADLATRTTERDQARTEHAGAQAQVDTFASFFGLKRTELAGKDSAALSAILAQKISDAAVEQLATAGVPAAQLPKQTQNEPTSQAEKQSELIAKYNAMPAATAADAEARAAFYKKHLAGNN